MKISKKQLAEYNKYEDIIEDVASLLSKKYKNIVYYDEDDIKQEVRIKCLESLKKYEEVDGINIKVYFIYCADNHLRDIRKVIYYRDKKPCYSCDLFDGAKCLVYSSRRMCKRFRQFERLLKDKMSIVSPSKIINNMIEDKKAGNVEKTFDFFEHICNSLGERQGKELEKVVLAGFDFSVLCKQRRDCLIDALTYILSEVYDG